MNPKLGLMQKRQSLTNL